MCVRKWRDKIYFLIKYRSKTNNKRIKEKKTIEKPGRNKGFIQEIMSDVGRMLASGGSQENKLYLIDFFLK